MPEVGGEDQPGWWVVRRKSGIWTAFRDRDAAVLLSAVTVCEDPLPDWKSVLPHG